MFIPAYSYLIIMHAISKKSSIMEKIRFLFTYNNINIGFYYTLFPK